MPTERGEEFLSYAKSILDQIDEIESLYKHDKQEKQFFAISIPRASYITHAFTRMVRTLCLDEPIEMYYKETNSMRAVNNLLQENYTLGIIRYQTVQEPYFLKMLEEKELKAELIWEFSYLALMSADHPLAEKAQITYDDLRDSIEIAHGDYYVPSLPLSEVRQMELTPITTKRIFVYERGSQFDLLSDVPSTYMWVSPIPAELIRRNGLVQRRCKEANRLYRDMLIYKKGYKFSELDKQFIEELKRSRDEVRSKQYI